jgi:hypothetical protein
MIISLTSATLAFFLGATSIAYARNGEPTESPPELIAGTHWVYVEKSIGGQTKQCEVDLSLTISGATQKRLFAFAFGPKGSPVIEVTDGLLIRQVLESLGWSPGRSYNVVIIPETGKGEGVPIDAQGEPLDERTILIYLPQTQRFLMNESYRSVKLFISVGGVGSKNYELPELTKAIDRLQTCPIAHMQWPAPGIN